MKKILLLSALIVCILSFSGCGEKDNQEITINTPAEREVMENKEAPVPATETNEKPNEPVDPSTCPCIEGFSLDEFGECSPDCTNTEEVCNGVDDDCDRKIDEDDVCVIDPFSATESIHAPVAHTIVVKDDGLFRRVSYNHIRIDLYPSSELERREFLEYLGTLNTKVVGQITGGGITWQVAVDEPDRLMEIRDEIGEHPLVERAWLGGQAGLAGTGNKTTDCPKNAASDANREQYTDPNKDGDISSSVTFW